MRTVSKALKILDLFTEETPVLGLVEIAGITGLDRATCHRMLKVLEEHGYVARPVASKKYTLGATVLRLARTREYISPTSATLQAFVDALAVRTTETCHASLIAGQQIATVAVRDGTRSNRVHVEYGARMELHATATGLACLAFGPSTFAEAGLRAPMTACTPQTVTSIEALNALLETFRAQGYSIANRSFDPEVVGIGAPIFGPDGFAMGAIAIATPSTRMNDATLADTAHALIAVAIEASQALGGRVPADYLRRASHNLASKLSA
ncbi:IclR family transcriptional regulator [Rhizobium sp. KVB221]|uniref:IclR family transcriptional regulator n=1 Tax=Rhizobium setariae TaxID=2801340 RepID=A0A936YPD6_9HYPH|nr:IclR family transcriptional regulator [Rhizobium setariae]MBL0374233.1 IclR family transcriptional regulator [Rhizobium setariae]